MAVTSGLLDKLDREELQGVIGHEMSHIGNLDIRFTLLVGVLVGAIALLADWFLRFTYWGGGRRSSSDSDRGGGGAAALIFALALILAIVAPLIGRLIQAAVSRSRESLADATAVEMTRNPVGLARALRTISDDHGGARGRQPRDAAPLHRQPDQVVRGAGEVAVGHPSADRRADSRPRGDRRPDGHDPLGPMEILPAADMPADRLRLYVIDTWHADFVVAHGERIRPAELPGFVAIDGDRIAGHAAYRIGPDGCELVAIAAQPRRVGIGSRLLARVVEVARDAGSGRRLADHDERQPRCSAVLPAARLPAPVSPTGAVAEARRTMKPDLPRPVRMTSRCGTSWTWNCPWRPESCDCRAPSVSFAPPDGPVSRGSSVGRALD